MIGGGFLAVRASEFRASYFEMRVAVARITTGFFDRWGLPLERRGRDIWERSPGFMIGLGWGVGGQETQGRFGVWLIGWVH